MKKLYNIIILFMLLHDHFCIQGSDTSTSSIESDTNEPSPKPKPKPKSKSKRVTFGNDVIERDTQQLSTRRNKSAIRRAPKSTPEKVITIENALRFFKLELSDFLDFLNQEILDLVFEDFLSNGKKSYLVLLDILENPYNHEYNADVENSENLLDLDYGNLTSEKLEAAWKRYQHLANTYHELLRNELRDKNRIFDAFATLGINSANFTPLYHDKNNNRNRHAAKYIQSAFERMARKSQEIDEFGNINTQNDFEEILEAYEFLKVIYPIDNVNLQEAYEIVGLANTATLDEAIRHKNAMLKSLSFDMQKAYLDAYDMILNHLQSKRRL